MSPEYLKTHPSLIILTITLVSITIIFIKYKKSYKKLLESCYKKEEIRERINISNPTLLTLENAEQLIPEFDTLFPGRQLTVLEEGENEENTGNEIIGSNPNTGLSNFNSPTEEARDIMFIATSRNDNHQRAEIQEENEENADNEVIGSNLYSCLKNSNSPSEEARDILFVPTSKEAELNTFFPGRQITLLEDDGNEENTGDEVLRSNSNSSSSDFNSPTEEAQDILFVPTSKYTVFKKFFPGHQTTLLEEDENEENTGDEVFGSNSNSSSSNSNSPSEEARDILFIPTSKEAELKTFFPGQQKHF